MLSESKIINVNGSGDLLLRFDIYFCTQLESEELGAKRLSTDIRTIYVGTLSQLERCVPIFLGVAD